MGDTRVEILNAQGQRVGLQGRSSEPRNAARAANLPAGTYFVAVTSIGDTQAEYQLSVNRTTSPLLCTPDRFDVAGGNELQANATAIGSGRQVNLTLCGLDGDEDWYVVTLDTIADLTLTLDFTFAQGNLDVDIYRDRNGFVLAEGSGVLVLEEMESAIARGATILAEVMGAASNADAYHITAPSPGGVGAINCMRAAIADAGLVPADVTYVNAHGTSTPLNDAAEAAAIAEVFGATPPAVTSFKGVTGHALGGAGSLEAVGIVLGMQKGAIPPTAGYANVDPDMAPIDIVVGEAREWTPAPVLSNSFGFGGHNGCVVIGPAPA